MRIGIFGGSFNPPHLMHEAIALELIKNGYVDKVIYVPTGNMYPKAGLACCEDRYEMVKRMISGNDKLEVSDYEFGKLTYTYQTLDYFKEKYHSFEIYFICGTDNLRGFCNWKNYEYILDNFKVIVIRRNNDDIDEILEKYSKKNENIIVCDISYDIISSTEIRKILKNNRKSKELNRKLKPQVLEYIYEKDLYN